MADEKKTDGVAGAVGYSFHDQDPGSGPAGRGWVVIKERLDEYGDVEDTDEVAFFKTEAAARRRCEQLRAGVLP